MARERDNRKLMPNAALRRLSHPRANHAQIQLIYYREITSGVPQPNGHMYRRKIADGYPS